MVSNMPKVSVIIPVYNAANFIRECLEGVLRQTLSDIEVICVDDGSTDASLEILREFEEKDGRVRVISQTNQYAGVARNNGLLDAKGEYIIFLDSDDLFEATMLEEAYSQASATNSDICVWGAKYYYETSGRYENAYVYLKEDLIPEEDYIIPAEYDRLFDFSSSAPWNKLFKREFLEAHRDIQFMDTKRFNDIYFVFCMLAQANKISVIRKSLVYYRQSDNSLQASREESIEDCIISLRKVKDYLKNNSLYDVHKKSLLVYELLTEIYLLKDCHSEELKQMIYEYIQKEVLGGRKVVGTLPEDLKSIEADIDRIQRCSFEEYTVSGNIIPEGKRRISFHGTRLHHLLVDRNQDLKSEYYAFLEENRKNDGSRIKEWSYLLKNNIKYIGYSEYRKVPANIETIFAEAEYVSFDIFDTLIARSVYEPRDLFRFLNKDFNELADTDNYIDFAKIRIMCERIARDRLKKEKHGYEDVTLKEIYEAIHTECGIDDSILEALMTKELELEAKLCHRRDAGYELFSLSKKLGKKIICISDMYLPIQFVEQLLDINGYSGIERIYLSSDTRVSKYSGKLFEYVKNDLQITKAQEIVHIGDNWHSDVIKAREAGIRAYRLPKANDMYRGLIDNVYKGELYHNTFGGNRSIVDGVVAKEFSSGIRSMLGIISNKLYDNPNENFDSLTDFNHSPYMIGYAALGMHLLSMVDWLNNSVVDEGYSKIHFLGRDGYLPIEAYKIVYGENPSGHAIEYTPMSRGLIALCDISRPVDAINTFDKKNLYFNTSSSVLDMFSSVIKVEKRSTIEEDCKSIGLDYYSKLEDDEDILKLLRLLAYELIDYELLEAEKDKLREYMNSIFKEGECIFDVGYSGRVESALTTLLGYPIDSFYIHVGEEKCFDRAKKLGFKVEAYYEFQPVCTYLIREQFISELGPSVKGIDLINGKYELIYGTDDCDEQEREITELVQQGALDFIRDYMNVFGEFRSQLNYKRQEASIPWEYFLHRAKEADREIFKSIRFEDRFGENREFNLYEWWSDSMARIDRTHK